MQFVSLPVRGAERQVRRLFAAAAVAGLAACSSSGSDLTSPTNPGPVLPGNPVQVPSLRQSAFIFDVDVSRGIVKVRVPEVSIAPRVEGANGQSAANGTTPSASILGKDVIEVQTSNFFASPVGAIAPNRVRVQFDVTLINKLTGARLITPTFPTPPAGQNGLILFPFSAVAVQTSGGIGIENDNVVVVELPRGGTVNASPDWNGNGAPDRPSFPSLPGAGGEIWNFFNDNSCTAVPDAGTTSDCYRYETFGPVEAAGISTTRRIGFDVDATVGTFRARLIAAADLVPTVAAVGTLTGTISSPQRGALAGVSVALQGVAGVQVTDAAGLYTFANVPTGTRTVTVTGLPSGCTTLTPASGVAVTLAPSTTTTQNFSATCTVPTGTIAGTLTRAGGGTQSLAGIQYTIQPGFAGAAPITGTVVGGGASASFSQAGVPIGLGAGAGTGSVSLVAASLPADCSVTAPASGSTTYAGLTDGGTISGQNFTITCTAPVVQPRYVHRAQWSAITGGNVDLTLTWDPTNCDPALNPNCGFPTGGTGSNAFGGVGSVLALSGTGTGRLGTRSAQPTANFGVAVLGPPPLTFGVNAASTGSFTTPQAYAIIRWAILAGAPGTVITSSTVSEVATPGGDAFTLVPTGAGDNLDFVEGTLTIP